MEWPLSLMAQPFMDLIKKLHWKSEVERREDQMENSWQIHNSKTFCPPEKSVVNILLSISILYNLFAPSLWHIVKLITGGRFTLPLEQYSTNFEIGFWCIEKYFFARSKQLNLQLVDNCTCSIIPLPPVERFIFHWYLTLDRTMYLI